MDYRYCTECETPMEQHPWRRFTGKTADDVGDNGKWRISCSGTPGPDNWVPEGKPTVKEYYKALEEAMKEGW